jgi:enoyl-CoA hydratase/carnithine racemase
VILAGYDRAVSDDTQGQIGITRRGAVAIVQIQRERKLNALSAHIETELKRAFADEQVRTARAVVLTGGQRAFSAGADLSEMPNPSAAQILEYYRLTGDMHERFADLPQPTVAAISGWCLGGGFELALAADIRIAHTDAKFGLPEVEIGIMPTSGGTLRLVRAVGPARAKELMLLRTRLSAQEALEAGCVTEVTDGDVLERAVEVAQKLAELPPLAAAITKQSINAVTEAGRDAALLIERLAYAALATTDESHETGQKWSGDSQ